MTKLTRIGLLVCGVVAVAASSARAQDAGDCLSGCNDAYQAAMSACQDQYGSAGQEVQLQQCMDSAQANLGTCSDACEAQD